MYTSFSAIVLPFALFASSSFAAAVPAAAPVAAAQPGLGDLFDHAQQWFDTKTSSGCEVVKCVTALAPTVVGCAAAVVEAGANPIADAACFASAVNAAVNPPASCDNCLEF